MSTIPIKIIRREDRSAVNAVLHRSLEPWQLAEAEGQWGPIRLNAARALYKDKRMSEIPEHYLWDWRKKQGNLQLLAYQCCGIECDGQVQGMIMLDLATKQARLAPDIGKPIVYVDYLETAPWNLEFAGPPRYAGVGTILMRTAIEISYEQGFAGRLGLHSLPQSEDFYRVSWKMISLGPDNTTQNLPYYEMTHEVAKRFRANSSGGEE